MSRVYEGLTEMELDGIEEDRTVVSFYQSGAGELVALAERTRDGEHSYRFIRNIEGMGYSAENILEQAQRGFDDFAELDSSSSGYSFGEIAFEITEGEDYKLVAELDGNVSGFVPENMDSRAAELFAPLMDSYVAEAQRYSSAAASAEHQCQLCFFAA